MACGTLRTTGLEPWPCCECNTRQTESSGPQRIGLPATRGSPALMAARSRAQQSSAAHRISSLMHALLCPGATSTKTGSTCAHAATAYRHRVPEHAPCIRLNEIRDPCPIGPQPPFAPMPVAPRSTRTEIGLTERPIRLDDPSSSYARPRPGLSTVRKYSPATGQA